MFDVASGGIILNVLLLDINKENDKKSCRPNETGRSGAVRGSIQADGASLSQASVPVSVIVEKQSKEAFQVFL